MPESLSSFTHDDYEIVKREVLHQGVFCLARYHVRHRLFDGSWGPVIQREILERLSAAAILPYDPISDRVVLIDQFRPGALAKPTSPWLVEIVAGVFGPGEKPHEVALREAVEEAGCVVTDLYPIFDFFVSPGGSNEYVHLYCGKIDASEIGGIHGLAHEHEDIRAYTVSAEEAFQKLKAGEIKMVPAIIALQWLQLNRELLRELWLENRR